MSKRRKILLAAFVVGALALVAIIILGIVLGTLLRKSNNDKANKSLFQFEDVTSRKFSPFLQSYNWINDTGFVFGAADGNVILYDAGTLQSEVFINISYVNELINNPSVQLSGYYLVSPSLRYILFAANQQKEWRHSFLADYVVFDRQLRIVFNVTNNSGKLANIRWAPSVQTNVVSYVRDNNIFVKNIDGNNPNTPEIEVTTDGVINQVINGVQSWVYEEEIFGDYNAMWFSPDANMIAFLRTNESAVPEFSFPEYQFDPNGPVDVNNEYPQNIVFKYPKA